MPLCLQHLTPYRRRLLGGGWLATWVGINAGVALGWLLGDPRRTSAAFYDVATSLLPLSVWAAVLGVVAVAILARPSSPWVWIAGSAYWTWWSFLSALVALQPGASASALGPLGTLGLAAAHGTTGVLLAWARD